MCLINFHANPNSKEDARRQVFQTLAAEIKVQIAEYHQKLKTKKWDYEIASRDLACQIGSLTKLLMQLKNERYRHQQTDSQIKEQIADELADILSHVVFISDELNIDLPDAWDNMIKSDQEKFRKREDK